MVVGTVSLSAAWPAWGSACRHVHAIESNPWSKCRFKIQPGTRKIPLTIDGRHFGEAQDADRVPNLSYRNILLISRMDSFASE